MIPPFLFSDVDQDMRSKLEEWFILSIICKNNLWETLILFRRKIVFLKLLSIFSTTKILISADIFILIYLLKDNFFVAFITLYILIIQPKLRVRDLRVLVVQPTTYVQYFLLHTPGLMKTIPSVYTLLMNGIYLSLSTQVADGTISTKRTVTYK